MDTVCGKIASTQVLLLLQSDSGNAHIEDVAYLRGLLQTTKKTTVLSPTTVTQAICSAAAMANKGTTTIAQTLENQSRE